MRRAFSLARLDVGRQRNSGGERMESTCSGTRPGEGATRGVSTRPRGKEGGGAYLDSTRGHLQLGSEFFAEDGVGLGIFSEDVLEDLELVP